MKYTALAPVLLLTLGACAADGTSVNTAATPAPATVSTTSVPVSTVPITAAPVATVPVVSPTAGQIIQSDAVQPIAQRGGNVALAIGASLLGAFIPGPWGSVASVATGQAGQYAMNSYDSKTMRYSVQMGDGTIRTITQSDPLALPTGTPVELVTLDDGTQRLVQTSVPVPIAAANTTL